MDDTDRQLGIALYRLRRFEASLLARHPEDEKPTDDEIADHLTLCDEVQRLSEKRATRLYVSYYHPPPPDPSED